MNAKKILMTAAVVGMMAACQVVNAITITPETTPVWLGYNNDQAVINTAVAAIVGTSTELYKQNFGDTLDTGSLMDSYVATFLNKDEDGEPADALITYVNGEIVGPTAWLLVKDGNHTPAWYLFNLTALKWNGTDDLSLIGFWPDGGSISHVSLYGSVMPDPDDNTTVPDGGTTIALLGLALSGLGYLRQRKA